MIHYTKYLLLIIVLLISSTLNLYSHKDTKNINEGIINPSNCEEHDSKHTYNCTLKFGFKGIYIISPARRYDIRKEDIIRVLDFLKRYKTRKVKVELLIHSRKNNIELWKIVRLIKR